MAQSVSRPTSRYLYEEIRDEIRARIEQGRYTEGERLPSTRDFVDEFSTTPVTINKALADLVETGHIHRVPKSGSFVNSRSDWATGRRQRTGIVGIVAFDTNVSIYWTKVVEAMQDALEERGYHAIIGYSDHSYEKALSYVDDLVEKGIDGLIFVPIDDQSREDYQTHNEAVCERIEEYGIPFVLFDRRLSNMRFSSVTADVYRAARELTEALSQAGSRRPACLTLTIPRLCGSAKRRFAITHHGWGWNWLLMQYVAFAGAESVPRIRNGLLSCSAAGATSTVCLSSIQGCTTAS